MQSGVAQALDPISCLGSSLLALLSTIFVNQISKYLLNHTS